MKKNNEKVSIFYKAIYHYSKNEPEWLKKLIKKEYWRCRNIFVKNFNDNIYYWDMSWRYVCSANGKLTPEQLDSYNEYISRMANEHIANVFNRYSKNRSPILEMYFDEDCDIRGRLRWNKKSTIDVEFMELES